MDQTEKLLIGIENILSVASDLVQEVDRLKRVEEESQMLKEKLFFETTYAIRTRSFCSCT